MIHKSLDKMFSWCSFSGIVHRSCEIHLEGRVYTLVFPFSNQTQLTQAVLAHRSFWISVNVCLFREEMGFSERAGAQQDSIHLPSAHSETRPRCYNELAELTSWANKLELLCNKDNSVISLKLKFLRV